MTDFRSTRPPLNQCPVRKWHAYGKFVFFSSSPRGFSEKCSGKFFCFFSHLANEACFYPLSSLKFSPSVTVLHGFFIFVLICETGSLEFLIFLPLPPSSCDSRSTSSPAYWF